jgi:hypothetical protein
VKAQPRIGYLTGVALGLSAASRRVALLCVIAVVDAALSLAAVYPLRRYLSGFALRPAVQGLAGHFDASVLVDLLMKHGDGVGAVLAALWVGLLLYLPLSWLLEGGVIGLLIETPEEASRAPLLARLGRAAGANFGRIVTAALTSLLVYAAGFIVLVIGLVVAGVATHGSVNQRHVLFATEIGAAPGIAFLLLGLVIADMLRVRRVLGVDGRGFRPWLKQSLRLGLRFRTSAARLTFTLLWVASTWMGMAGLAHLPHHGVALLFGFLVSLLLLVVRAALGVGAYATLVGLTLDEANEAAATSASAA